MFYQRLKVSFSFVLALVIILGGISFASASSVEYDIYNITRNIGYTYPLTNYDLKEINRDASRGHEFAKRIGGKLVNFNDYYDALVEVFVENSDLPDDEIIDKIVESIADIIANLPEVEVGGETPIEVDPVELEAAIEDAKALVETDYTPATWAILEEALAAAELVLEDPNATQEQIDEALLELKEAMASLVKETPTEATVTAVYEASLVPFMGYVKATAYNIPEAAKYTVTYKLSDERTETSPFMLFGQTEGLPLIFQNETVTISVYDANSNLIDVFQNVSLVK